MSLDENANLREHLCEKIILIPLVRQKSECNILDCQTYFQMEEKFFIF